MVLGSIDTEYGKISITDDVMASIAGNAAVENYGIVGMVAKKTSDGINQLLGRDNIRKGVQVSMEDGQVTIDLYVMIQYGVSINAVAENAIHNIAYQVQENTGFPVKAVNVHVEGIRVQNDQ